MSNPLCGGPGRQRLAAASSRLFSVASSAANFASLTAEPFRGRTPAYASTAAGAGVSGSQLKGGKNDVLAPVQAWNSETRYIMHRLNNIATGLKYRTGLEKPTNKPGRKRIVFLGTGWGAMRFLPVIDTSKYEVVLVAPRNFFVFTPLLPSVCSGALSVKSCVEPIRSFTVRGGKKAIDYMEGRAQDVNFENNSVSVMAANGYKYDVNYDYLVVGVGSEPATFGIPGVAENAYFLKESENAEAIRRKVLHNFELASLPGVTQEEQRRLLHLVCVGGGPSGIETAAELSDLVQEDIARFYPTLLKNVKISVIELLPRVLPAFNEAVSNFTLKNFAKMNVQALIKTRVTKVTSKAIHVVNSAGKDEELPCGFVMWASGIGPVPLSKKIMATVPEQQNLRPPVLRVNQNLLLNGVSRRNVFALGDCSFLAASKLADHADGLYAAAQSHPNGAGTDFLKTSAELLYRFPQLAPTKMVVKVERNQLDKKTFLDLLKEVDAGYKPPVPTAQNAGQQGRWLACMMNDFDPSKDQNILPSFVESFKGALAYVGDGESVALTPWFNIIGGFHSTLFWKAVYWSMQMSIRNRVLLLNDWARVRLAGRDLSCPRTADLSERKEGTDQPEK